MNNSFGEILRTTIFGASHAEEVGVSMEGVPSGIALGAEVFTSDLDRRRPMLKGETPRREEDFPIIEGLDNQGLTTGRTIRISFKNRNTRSGDYSKFVEHPRPSHADLVQRKKYGEGYDISGGGISSGRMTVALVSAGVVAKQVLGDVVFSTHLIEVGGCRDAEQFEQIIANALADGDSVGGVVECRVQGVDCGLGEPFFDSVESVVSHLLFSVPGVKAVAFGDGFDSASKRASERNDMIVDGSGRTLTNNEGGVNGGISNGNDIVVRVAVKPTPSISKPQNTYNFATGCVEPLVVGGRHDACIARRAMVVIEAMVALALADLKLRAR
ncbi:MAG: chorismate synthase [Alistipes sp.]|nr:chorismate synthase [Alistipes sp.]